MINEELKRIVNNNNGEIPETTKIVIRVKNVDNPDEVLSNTKEIMRAISQFAYTDF